MTNRIILEELNEKKALLSRVVQEVDADKQQQGTYLQGSELRACFPKPVCVEVTGISDESMVAKALRWEEREKEVVKENKEWVKEKNRVILERGKEVEQSGWKDAVPEEQEEEELIGALVKAWL